LQRFWRYLLWRFYLGVKDVCESLSDLLCIVVME
jgi:hypothetical protein